jgi:hypothetical protein
MYNNRNALLVALYSQNKDNEYIVENTRNGNIFFYRNDRFIRGIKANAINDDVHFVLIV